MVKILPRRGEKIQQTLRRFRKICDREGITKETRRKVYYETPSETRNRLKRKIKRDREKELREEQLTTSRK